MLNIIDFVIRVSVKNPDVSKPDCICIKNIIEVAKLNHCHEAQLSQITGRKIGVEQLKIN